MNIDRLILMHKMILRESTGTREEFAEVFNIKKRQLQNQIDDLKIQGADIGYSFKRATYFYKSLFDLAGSIDHIHIFSRLRTDNLKEMLKDYIKNKIDNG